MCSTCSVNASALAKQLSAPKFMGELGRKGELGREVTGLEGREKHRAMGRTRVRGVRNEMSVWKNNSVWSFSLMVRGGSTVSQRWVARTESADAESERSGEESLPKVEDPHVPSGVVTTGELLRVEEVVSSSLRPV